MSSIRDKIASADDSSYEDVEIPEWDVTIRVVSPDLRERNALVKQFPEEGEDVDFDAVYVNVITATATDPETGERVFTDDDADLILSKNGAVVQPLFMAGKAALGLDGSATLIDAGKGG